MGLRLQRLTSLALALLIAAPLSLFAETRPSQRSDLRELAAELERVLGKGSVEIEGTESAESPDLQPYIDAMNRERAARGERPLRINRALCAAANDRVRDMFAQHYFNHDAPDGTQPFVWVTREGYDYQEVGENLAVGYRGAGATVDGWMGSPGHRANILNKAFDEVGLAVAGDSPVRGYRGPLVVALYGCR